MSEAIQMGQDTFPEIDLQVTGHGQDGPSISGKEIAKKGLVHYHSSPYFDGNIGVDGVNPNLPRNLPELKLYTAGLTNPEKAIVEKTNELLTDYFVLLHDNKDDADPAFEAGLRMLRYAIAMRVARRNNPELWK